MTVCKMNLLKYCLLDGCQIRFGMGRGSLSLLVTPGCVLCTHPSSATSSLACPQFFPSGTLIAGKQTLLALYEC